MSQFADKNFEYAWFSGFKGKQNPDQDLVAVRDYAYASFDNLDADHNGFIEMRELHAALARPNISMQERSFITFLLNNHKAICDSFAEPGKGNPDGITRLDLDSYFKLVIDLLKV